jgi:hypothetical protein
LLKTGFFREVRELEIQRKIPGSALQFVAPLHQIREARGSKKIKKKLQNWVFKSSFAICHIQKTCNLFFKFKTTLQTN